MTQNQCTTLIRRFEPLYLSLSDTKCNLQEAAPKDVMTYLGHTAAVVSMILDELKNSTDNEEVFEFSDEVLRTIANFTLDIGCRIDMVINSNLSYADVIKSSDLLLKYLLSAINIWKLQEMFIQFANTHVISKQSKNILFSCADKATRISYLIGLDDIMS